MYIEYGKSKSYYEEKYKVTKIFDFELCTYSLLTIPTRFGDAGFGIVAAIMVTSSEVPDTVKLYEEETEVFKFFQDLFLPLKKISLTTFSELREKKRYADETAAKNKRMWEEIEEEAKKREDEKNNENPEESKRP